MARLLDAAAISGQIAEAAGMLLVNTIVCVVEGSENISVPV